MQKRTPRQQMPISGELGRLARGATALYARRRPEVCMRRRSAFILSLAGISFAGVGALLALRAARPAVAGSAGAESTRAATPSRTPAPSALASAAGEPAPLASSVAAAPSAAPNAAKSAPRVDPARRQQADRIRERLRADRAAGRLRTRRTEARSGSARADAPAFDHMPALEGEGNQAERPLGVYVRNTVRERFIPLTRRCSTRRRREKSA